MRGLSIAALVVALAAGGAGAQEAAGPSDSARFTFHRAGDAFLRLDVRTGRVAQCKWEAGGWFCRAVPDERAALEAEIARLAAHNAALKQELLTRGLPLPDGIKPDPAVSRNGDAESADPRTVGFERLRRHVENVWRQLIKMIADLQRDILRRT